MYAPIVHMLQGFVHIAAAIYEIVMLHRRRTWRFDASVAAAKSGQIASSACLAPVMLTVQQLRTCGCCYECVSTLGAWMQLPPAVICGQQVKSVVVLPHAWSSSSAPSNKACTAVASAPRAADVYGAACRRNRPPPNNAPDTCSEDGSCLPN
jgi:hypothetical protein